MGRLGKLKRQAIQEANERNLGIIEENHAGFSLGFANNGGLSIQEEEITETTEAEEVEEEGDGEEVNDVVEEQINEGVSEITISEDDTIKTLFISKDPKNSYVILSNGVKIHYGVGNDPGMSYSRECIPQAQIYGTDEIPGEGYASITGNNLPEWCKVNISFENGPTFFECNSGGCKDITDVDWAEREQNVKDIGKYLMDMKEQDDFGDGAEGDGESPLEQVTEGSFSQYNITLDD